MSTSKEHWAKRPIRRNGSARAGHQPLYPAAASAAKNQHPQAGRPSNRNNKYLALEERAREQRRLLRIAEEAQEAWSGRGGGPGWMLAATDTGGNMDVVLPPSTKRGESRMRMTRVDGFNSTAGPSPQKSNTDLQFADRACIPVEEVPEVLENLSGTLIFNSANRDERLALASRLRHWVVADGTYLIREGDGDRNRSAIFMIASGKATISLNRKVEGGSVQEVDIKDIKSPNYFGEGRVLGDSRAYASVRAKEELVVYYIMRADIEELVSPTTRALMERDMLVRKFQKENLDDLFAVVRQNPSGMQCLARFAEEQRMGGEVGFFMEVKEYQEGKANDENDEATKQHAERIVSTYISPSASGVPASLIYTSEAQRKALAAKMKRLWRRERPKHKGNSVSRSGGDDPDEGTSAGKGGNPEERRPEQGSSLDDGRGVAKAGRSPVPDDQDGCGGDDSGGIDDCDVGDGSSDCDGEMMNGIEDEKGCPRSLFDQILDQNAIPTIRQNIVPKFIQSSFYEIFLAELFPQVGVANSKGADMPESSAVHVVRGSTDERSGIVGRRLRSTVGTGAGTGGDDDNGGCGDGTDSCRTDSLDAIRGDPEALVERITLAVEVVRQVAAAAAAAATAEGGDEALRSAAQSTAGVSTHEPDLQAGPLGAGKGQQRLKVLDEGGGSLDEQEAAATSGEGVVDDDEEFSDELLVVVGFKKGGYARRVSTGGIARIEEKAGTSCVVM